VDYSIYEPDMADLPDDDELAFVVYEERLREKTRGHSSQLSEYGDSISVAREYANRLAAFIRLSKLSIPISLEPPFNDAEFWDWYNRFVHIIDYYIVEFKLAHARRHSKGIVSAISFSQNYKEEIGHLLERVRKVIRQADLSGPKKDAIYEKVAQLQAEVDRSTTWFSSLLSRWLDLTNALGEGAENLEPVARLMERLWKVFGRAKAEHDRQSLPPPERRKELPSPKSEASDTDDLDDEIPF